MAGGLFGSIRSNAANQQYNTGQKALRYIFNPKSREASYLEPQGLLGGYKPEGTSGGGLSYLGTMPNPLISQSQPQTGIKLSPLGPPNIGPDNGGYSSSDVAAQQKAIQDARQAYLDRAARYSTYFDAQAAELDRQKQAEQQAVIDAKAAAGKAAGENRTSLGEQNTQQQAGINKGAQASGIFDSSARVGAIDQTQHAFNSALTQLNDQEQQYYSGLDKQLTDQLAQYNLQKMSMDINKADTAQEIKDKLASFDQAQQQLTSQISSVRQSAIDAASKRQTDFYNYLGKLGDTIGSLSPDVQTQYINMFAQQYGVDPAGVAQQLTVSQLVKQLTGSSAAAAAAKLKQLGLDPAQYGYTGG